VGQVIQSWRLINQKSPHFTTDSGAAFYLSVLGEVTLLPNHTDITWSICSRLPNTVFLRRFFTLKENRHLESIYGQHPNAMPLNSFWV
jgi:hypothetical protein